jgi:hypothetical protein
MLRFLVLLLLLANGVYFAWSQGLLRVWGYAPAEEAEPQHMAQQIRPEAIRLLRADEARRAEAAASAKPPECLVAGPLDDAQAAAVRSAADTVLPASTWAIESITEPARWIVYMGKYPSAQALAVKRAELSALRLKFEPVNNTALEPGLSLGGFETRMEADKSLADLGRRGVRTAKVVQEKAEVKASQLRIAAADDAIRARLDELKPALAGKPLRDCK